MARSQSIDIAHAWAHQSRTYGKSGSVFFEYRTIFSYGYHYPIAVIDEKDPHVVWFNATDSSNTTSKHKSWVRGSVSHKEVIEVSRPPYTLDPRKDKGWQQREINGFIGEINALTDKLQVARKPEIYISQIHAKANELRRFTEILGIKPTKALQAVIDEPLDGTAHKYSEAEQSAMRRREKARIKKQADEASKALQEWKRNEHSRTHLFSNAFDHTYLRLNDHGTAVETSKGIVIPLPVAKRYYNTVVSLAAEGGCRECHQEMMGFKVSEITSNHLLVGCHDIPMTEIKDIAARLGWKVDRHAGVIR